MFWIKLYLGIYSYLFHDLLLGFFWVYGWITYWPIFHYNLHIFLCMLVVLTFCPHVKNGFKSDKNQFEDTNH